MVEVKKKSASKQSTSLKILFVDGLGKQKNCQKLLTFNFQNEAEKYNREKKYIKKKNMKEYNI